MADVNNIIRHHAVSAFDKVEHAFGLAHVAVAHVKHADAIDIDETAVDDGMRRKEILENPLRHLEEFKRMERRRKERNMQTVAHRLQFIVRSLRMGHDPHRSMEYG